jgi:hypothetical protein
MAIRVSETFAAPAGLLAGSAQRPRSPMKSNSSSRFAIVLLLTMLLAACATTPMSRIDANRAAYESWPLDVQEAILNGEAKKGMTPEQVKVALGTPTEVVPRGTNEELWVYRTGGSGSGSSLLRNTGLSIGGGIGGIGVSGIGGGGGGRQSSSNEHEVVFENGVVTRAD